ncbi:MAG: FkbM family methyltransferase [Chloroflexota bacterium]|nr:FkbM family methyltransferase [Chloroflexota bacterium]
MNTAILNLIKYGLRWGTPLPRQLVNGYLEWTLIRDVLREYAVDCVLDVGANTGQYARNLRRVGYEGHICSFEPVDDAFASLSAGFRSDSRWSGFNYALGSENIQMAINIAVESTAMSSFLSPKDANWRLRQAVVDVYRLDSVYEDVIRTTGLKHPCVFLKMDTQGYDLEVVSGAASCIDQIKGIQSEVSVKPVYAGMPHYLEAISVYESLGFRLHSLAEVSRHPDTKVIIEMNCVMMRR